MFLFGRKKLAIDCIPVACAFTGHRPQRFKFKYNENDPGCIALKKALRNEIEALADQGVNYFISGMALGVDMWAAEIVLELKKAGHNIKLECAIPCENQDIKWADSSRRRYAAILRKADKITYVSREYTPNCMFERNRYMVDNAKYIIAVYDGGNAGGTAATVRYAQQKNIIAIVINPDTYEVVKNEKR